MTTCQRQAVVRSALGALMLLVAVSAARAGDPVAGSFKKAAKAQVKAVKSATKEAVKSIKVSLKGASDGYADGSLTAAEALSAMQTPLADARDVLADAVLAGFTQLAADGHQLLVDAGSPAPGPDFQAGGGGAWDDALNDAEAALDKADDQMRDAVAKWVKDMGKAAKAQDVAIDIRFNLPGHSDDFWAVIPPAGIVDADLTDGPREDIPAPQVLIEVRLVETNTTETLGVFIRSDAGSVDVNLASTDSDGHTADTLVPGPFGTVGATLSLAALDHVTGFITLQLNDGTLNSPVVAMSAPSLAAPDPATLTLLADFEKNLKTAKKDFAKDTAAAVKELKAVLPTHKKAVKKGFATPELALRTGFNNLRDAREGIGVAWNNFKAVGAATSAALADAEFDDEDLPPGFQPGFAGNIGKLVAQADEQAVARQASASTFYGKFATSILKQAQKQDAAVGANLVAGRIQYSTFSPITAADAPPPVPSVIPHLTDVVTVVVTDQFSALLMVQADPTQLSAVSTSATTIPDGDVTDLGELSIRPGGTQQDEVPLLGDIPILGWLFKGGANDDDQASIVIVGRPTLVTGGR